MTKPAAINLKLKTVDYFSYFRILNFITTLDINQSLDYIGYYAR